MLELHTSEFVLLLRLFSRFAERLMVQTRHVISCGCTAIRGGKDR